jgi:hypothetical protein
MPHLLRLAAMIALIMGVYGVYRTYRNPPPRVVLHDGARRPSPDPASPDGVDLGITLQAESAKTMLAVAVPTDQANVQMYWLYPSLEALADSNQAFRH